MNEASKNPWGKRLTARAEEGLLRKIPITQSPTLNFASNDYLSLANDPRIVTAGQEALATYGNSSTASPLICGYGDPHHELEEALKEWYGLPAALIFNTGYSANQAVLSQLPQEDDLILADRLIHNSMIHGILGSGARLIRYEHLHIDQLEDLLKKHSHGRRVWVITESVFSMDGDYPALSEIALLKKKYDFYWMVDEAHALGWYGARGSGLVEEFDALGEVDILLGTMGKAFGGFGAFVLFRDSTWREYLVNFAPEFIYSTYLPPALAVTGRAAIDLIKEISKEERKSFQAIAITFRSELRKMGYEVIGQESPILSFIVGENEKLIKVSQALLEDGILVGSIRPPTVPRESARLRISINRNTSEEDIQLFCKCIEKIFD